MAALIDRAFDLDAAEEAVVVGGDVVGCGLSPGLGDAKSAFYGTLEETEFGPLSAALGVSDVLARVGALVLHELSWVVLGNKKRGPWAALV